MNIRSELRAVQKLVAGRLQAAGGSVQPGQYAGDPARYCREVLGVTLWSRQLECVEAIHRPPYRVLARSSHSVGKTFMAACLVNYWFDTYKPGCVITTAPTARDVRDLLWSEVRLLRQRAGLGGFRGESAPELYDGPDHYAKGFTAARGESFQGRHPERMLLLFDEATGIDATFWATARTMFSGCGKHAWVCTFNPTDTSSQAHAEEMRIDEGGRPAWTVVEVSSLEHPNIKAALAGRQEPYPGAVNLSQFEDWLGAWSDPIAPGDVVAPTDLEWPPGSGNWFRPGPLMEGRALGRYPSSATYGVWSDRIWQLATSGEPGEFDLSALPEIGCDVARHGDDYTAIHCRWGNRSLRHERHNGWEYPRTAERLKELCGEMAALANQHRPPQAVPVRAEEIPVKLDADAYGWGVYDHRGEFNFVGLAASSASLQPKLYPNRRSELWFTTVERARAGGLSLAGIPREHVQRLRQQLFAPQWFPDGAGRMVVEPKAVTKKRLGCSPDDADALNLAYALATSDVVAEVVMADPDARGQRAGRARFGVGDRKRDEEPRRFGEW